MTIEAIKEILTGTFTSEEDRNYWERKLAEAERKERSARANERYFNKMSVYDR